jgi:hypothetical protein
MSRLEKLRLLADQQPNDPFVHYGVGLEYAAHEMWNEAIAAFDCALAVDAQYHTAHLQKAGAEIKLGRRAAARATLEAGVAAARAQRDTHAAMEMTKLLETLG